MILYCLVDLTALLGPVQDDYNEVMEELELAREN
jgi:hypothetical protein